MLVDSFDTERCAPLWREVFRSTIYAVEDYVVGLWVGPVRTRDLPTVIFSSAAFQLLLPSRCDSWARPFCVSRTERSQSRSAWTVKSRRRCNWASQAALGDSPGRRRPARESGSESIRRRIIAGARPEASGWIRTESRREPRDGRETPESQRPSNCDVLPER
jgi:hypothetical protein